MSATAKTAQANADVRCSYLKDPSYYKRREQSSTAAVPTVWHITGLLIYQQTSRDSEEHYMLRSHRKSALLKRQKTKLSLRKVLLTVSQGARTIAAYGNIMGVQGIEDQCLTTLFPDV